MSSISDGNNPPGGWSHCSVSSLTYRDEQCLIVAPASSEARISVAAVEPTLHSKEMKVVRMTTRYVGGDLWFVERVPYALSEAQGLFVSRYDPRPDPSDDRLQKSMYFAANFMGLDPFELRRRRESFFALNEKLKSGIEQIEEKFEKAFSRNKKYEEPRQAQQLCEEIQQLLHINQTTVGRIQKLHNLALVRRSESILCSFSEVSGKLNCLLYKAQALKAIPAPQLEEIKTCDPVASMFLEQQLSSTLMVLENISKIFTLSTEDRKKSRRFSPFILVSSRRGYRSRRLSRTGSNDMDQGVFEICSLSSRMQGAVEKLSEYVSNLMKKGCILDNLHQKPHFRRNCTRVRAANQTFLRKLSPLFGTHTNYQQKVNEAFGAQIDISGKLSNMFEQISKSYRSLSVYPKRQFKCVSLHQYGEIAQKFLSIENVLKIFTKSQP